MLATKRMDPDVLNLSICRAVAVALLNAPEKLTFMTVSRSSGECLRAAAARVMPAAATKPSRRSWCSAIEEITLLTLWASTTSTFL